MNGNGMQKALIVCTGFFVVSILFMVMHWPGASSLKILSCSLIAVLSFIMGIRKKITWYERAFYFLSSFVFIGGLFKIMYWHSFLPSYKGVTLIGLFLLAVIRFLWTKPNEQLHSHAMMKPALLSLYVIFALVFSVPQSELYKFHRITSVSQPQLASHELYNYYQLASFYAAENRKSKAVEALQIAKNRMSDVTHSSFLGPSGNLLDTQEFQSKINELEQRINALP